MTFHNLITDFFFNSNTHYPNSIESNAFLNETPVLIVYYFKGYCFTQNIFYYYIFDNTYSKSNKSKSLLIDSIENDI